MKFTILIISVLFTSASLFAQVNFNECIHCGNNEIKKLSSAIGSSNISTGEYSLSAGYLNIASGNYSGAFGRSAVSSGNASFAFGESVQASGNNNFALGNGCLSDGIGSFSIGILSNSSEISSYTFGSYLANTGAFSILMGTGISPGQRLNNVADHSFAVGFNSNISTFIVSSSSGLNKTGKIGIGNIPEPQAKLHIMADNNEDATIKLQPTGADYNAKILFGDNGHLIYGKPGESLKFKSQDTQDFLFENGNIVQEQGHHIITDKIIGSLSNKLQLFDNTNGITITNGGKVGIMNGYPQYQLSINGDMLVGSDAQFNGNISLALNKFIETNRIQALDADGLELFNMSGNGIFVDNTGKIGINNQTPNATLDVGGTITVSDVALFNGNVGINNQLPNATLDVGGTLAVANNALFNGNVGIGTNTPDEELEVNGRIKTTQLQITDGATNTYDHVLISDQNGVASWVDPSFLDDGDWYTNEGNGKIFHITTNVGIRTSDPISAFEVNGDIVVGNTNKKFILHSGWSSNKLVIAPVNSAGGGEWNKTLTLFENGNVGIGVTDVANATAHLTVKGDILAREVRVRDDAGGADFVFAENYNLPDLDDIKDFINDNKHLPEIPSAEEMKENGINVGELQIKLLQKIEELTLYVIELKEENEEIKGEIEKLKED